MYKNIFVFCFIFASSICYITDICFPYMRVKMFTRDAVNREYRKMLPLAGCNLACGYAYLKILQEVTRNHHKNSQPFVLNFIVWYMFADVLFYCMHWMLHTKKLYWIHKIHHEYIHTFGMGAIYSHPIEFVINNLIPLTLPTIVLGIPEQHNNIIIIISTLSIVIISHGGYLPLNSHTVHHYKMNCNYGLGIVDTLLGTQNKI